MSSERDRLGHYEILGPLGAGGMGEVFVGRDPILGRKVALKVLPNRLAGDRETLTRFTQEARSASALNHPNIVTIYEVGTDNGTPYIVMEHIEGRDLRTIVNEGPLPNRKALDLAAQIADGLAAAHEQGIVHRDLKPENLMLTKDGFVKILDFGLAKVLRPTPTDSDQTAQLEMPGTNPGTILGTVGYMSPEQATGRALDYRSDQFALGAILYELATGRCAFEGENAIDTLSAILHDEPPPIRDFNMKAPEPFCWIIERLLSKDPEERYASTRDLARELRTVRDKISAEPSSMDLPKPRRRPNPRLKKFAAIAGAIVLLAGLGALGIWIGRRSQSGDPVTGTTAPPPIALQQKNYLAVLRFSDMSNDPSGQLVADGIAETLSARLARVPSIQLMRAASSETLAKTDVEEIGRDLGVNLVLRGSMQRDGTRLRVSYSILDVRTRSEVTGDTIDGSTDDLFEVQDKLVSSVVAALDPTAEVSKITRLDPAMSQKQYLEALGHLRRYDKEDAVNAAIKILEDLGARTNSASIQAALGRAYMAKFTFSRDTELTRKATLYCERALTNDPQNTDVRVTLGHVRLQTGRAEDAIREFKQVLQLQPNNIDAILGLAEAYQANNNLPEAEAAYKRAIAEQPQYWSPYNRLGVLYILHGRYADSAKMFEKVIQLVPDNLRGYNNLGAAYQQMGRYDDAIGVISRTIEQKPTAQGYSNLGTCYYFLGRYREAASAFEKATEMLPSKYLYWANLGDAYRWTPGSEDKAARAFDRAIELSRDELRQNSQDARIRARLADCLAKRGNLDEARRNIEQAIQADAKNPGTLYRAAVVAAIAGEEDRALQWLRQAVKSGYSKAEIQLDPEFKAVRQSAAFQDIIRGSI